MEKHDDTAARKDTPKKETVTPFLERSITELIGLFAQLFTTPFALLSYSKSFRDQITALSKDDLETAYPETVARPLTFFVLLVGAHLFSLGLYWRLVFPAKSVPSAASPRAFADAADKIFALFKTVLVDRIGNAQAIIVVAFGITFIIAVKAYLVSGAGYLLRCPVRFKSALYASAYALGTFIFFQYIFIALRRLAATVFGDTGFHLAYAINAYGSLLLSMLLVIRVNQIIRQSDGTAEFATYGAWIIGTIVWHFCFVLCFVYLLGLGDFWSTYILLWQAFGRALYPPIWYYEAA